MHVDTVIVGSGVAATSVAQRLLDRDPKRSILLVEAGPKIKTKDFALWENYLITNRLPYEGCRDLDYPQKDQPGENISAGGTEVPLYGARLIAYGGSTLHWGGWSFRLKPEDFSLFSNTGQGADWPITYADLESYYCEAEHYLGVSGDSADSVVPRSRDYPYAQFPFTLQDRPLADALDKLQLPYSHVPIAREGIGAIHSRRAPCHSTGTCKYCPFGARYAATNALNDMLAWEDYPNLQVISGAVVEKVTLAGPRRAAGVQYRDVATDGVFDVTAELVVIAAGTVESAKLLQRSTAAEWPNGIGNRTDHVGRHFVTHPYFVFSAQLDSNPLALQPEMNFPTLCSRYYDSPAEQKAGKYILVNPPDTVNPLLVRNMQQGKTRAQIDDIVKGPSKIQVHGMIEVFGKPTNLVKNSIDLNRFGLYQTIVDYTKDPAFDARMDEIDTSVDAIFATMGATPTGKPSVSWRADHAGSTCRMSADEASGVVDADLRVHGMDNLYVCSNAVFPSIGAINPTLTLTALSLRLGDHLGKPA